MFSKVRIANVYVKKHDLENAKKYYLMLEKENIVAVKNNLGGIFFEMGEFEKSIKYFKKIISKIDLKAVENLGDAFFMAKDYLEAIECYKMVSDSVECKVKIAECYEEKEDFVNTAIWYKKAADSGDLNSAYKVARLLENKGNVNESIPYYKKNAEHGDLLSKLFLGRIYLMNEKYKEAEFYLQEPAREGNTYAQHTLGIIYENIVKDNKKAEFWYEKARKSSCVESIYSLAILNLKKNDYENANKLLEEGISLNCKRCEYVYACIMQNKAFSIFKKLIDEGYEKTNQIASKIFEIPLVNDEVLSPKFDIKPFEFKKIKRKFIMNYDFEIKENIEDMLNGSITGMVMDQGMVLD